MFLSQRNRRAAAALEYIVLFIVIIAALVAMGRYIQNGLQGQYQTTGETFGFGEQ